VALLGLACVRTESAAGTVHLNNILSAVRKLKVSIAEAREPPIVLPWKKRKEAKERKRHMRLEKKREAMAEK
jgi:hypothetical protein